MMYYNLKLCYLFYCSYLMEKLYSILYSYTAASSNALGKLFMNSQMTSVS